MSKSPDFKFDLATLLEFNPVLRELPEGTVRLYYGIMHRYAPTLSQDPIVAGSFVRQQAGLGVVDVSVVRQLIETEQLYITALALRRGSP